MSGLLAKPYLVLYCYVMALLFALYTPYEAYFSYETEDHGLNSEVTSIVFASKSLSNLLISFFVPAILESLGRKKATYCGLYALALVIGSHGLLVYSQNKASFYISSIVAGLLSGAAMGITYTGTVSSVSYLYRENLDKAIGVLKAHVGVGLTLGMLISAAMHLLGGFPLCCFAFAGLTLIAGVLVQITIPKGIDDDENDAECAPSKLSHTNKRRATVCELLCLSRYLACLIGAFFVAMIPSALLTVLSSRYTDLSAD